MIKASYDGVEKSLWILKMGYASLQLEYNSQTVKRLIFISLLLSLFAHFSILFFVYRSPIYQNRKADLLPSIDVSVVEAPKTIAESLQETAREKPDIAKFESSRNLKAEEETSPDRAPLDMPNVGGQKSRPSAQKSKVKTQAKSGTLFSMNQAEVAEEREMRETLAADGLGVSSSGFMERLKRGEMLKINAGESDYAQFIRRMKEKLLQHWSPQKTVSTAMYQYNEVRVDVAVILNSQGEIVELRILQPSRFPNYDQESIRALREAGPFPNPHRSLIQDDGFVYMPWSFTLFMGGSGRGAGIE